MRYLHKLLIKIAHTFELLMWSDNDPFPVSYLPASIFTHSYMQFFPCTLSFVVFWLMRHSSRQMNRIRVSYLRSVSNLKGIMICQELTADGNGKDIGSSCCRVVPSWLLWFFFLEVKNGEITTGKWEDVIKCLFLSKGHMNSMLKASWYPLYVAIWLSQITYP